MPSADVSFVLIHGGASSSRFWDLLIPFLELPAFAVDMPGRTGKPADPMTLTVDECVSSMVDDIEPRGLGEVVLVAHSSGGLFTPVSHMPSRREFATSSSRRGVSRPRAAWGSRR